MFINWLVVLTIVLCAFASPCNADEDNHQHEETPSGSGPIEEFTAYNPMEFHNLAMSAFMEMRKQDPKVNLSTDGEFMKRGTIHAIRRNRRRPEEALTLRVCCIYSYFILC